MTRAAGVVPSADHLVEAAQAANRAVWDQAEANPEMRGMGTTLVALALVDGDRLAVINIGDSRLYAMRRRRASTGHRRPQPGGRAGRSRAGCPRRRPSSTPGATS